MRGRRAESKVWLSDALRVLEIPKTYFQKSQICEINTHNESSPFPPSLKHSRNIDTDCSDTQADSLSNQTTG